jgi:hypothetical protein
MVVNNAGNMLIGTTTDAGYKLDVNGTARVSGGIFQSMGTSSLNLLVAGTTSQTSDRGVFVGNGSFNNASVVGIAIGNNTTLGTGTGNIAIGFTANASGGSIAISKSGLGSTASGGGIAINGTSTGGIAIGGTTNTSGAIGISGSATATNAVAVGLLTAASGNFSLAIGDRCTASHTQSIAIGLGSKTSAVGDFVAGGYFPNGGYGIYNVYFGTGPQGNQTNEINGDSYAINGSGGFGTNKNGGNLTLAGGKGTGNGTPGDVIISTATSGSTGSTLQTLTTRLVVKANTGNVGMGTTSPGDLTPNGWGSGGRSLEILGSSNESTGLFLRRGNFTGIGLDLWSANGLGSSYIDNRYDSAGTSGVTIRVRTAGTPRTVAIFDDEFGAKLGDWTNNKSNAVRIEGDLSFRSGSGPRTITGPANTSLILNALPLNSNEGVILQYNGTTGLVFNNLGNVFIGSSTTDLGFKLSVSGSTLLRGSGTTSASYALATQNSSGGTTMVVNNAGNMLIGTTTDAGYRLDVNGPTRIKGAGSTSGTTSFLVQNSSGTENLKITDDSTLFFKGGNNSSLRIKNVIESNSAVVQFSNDGLGGGYGGGFTFSNGHSGLYYGNVAMRIWGGSLSGSKVAIGNVSEPTIQNATTNLYVDNTQTGGRNAAIKLNVNFANITTEYNGIQFDTIEGGAGGAFIGSQHNPLTNGYGGDFVVLATTESPNYLEIARFVGKSQSLSLGAGKTPTAKLHLSGSSGSTLFEIDSNSYQNIINVSGLGNVLIGTSTNNNSRLLIVGTVSGATLNTTRGVHVSPTLLATGSTTTLIGLDIQPTFTPGSFTGLTQLALRVSGGTQIIGSGSTGTTLSLFSVDGASGRLFDVTDDFSNSLFSVNTSSGVPVIEAFANNSIVMGTYGSNTLVVSGTSVSVGTSTSNSTSVLNIVSTTKGVQFPRMTTAQKNSLTGATDILGGLVVFDTNTNKLCCYNGTTWNDLF